jgi:hypothetical protein
MRPDNPYEAPQIVERPEKPEPPPRPKPKNVALAVVTFFVYLILRIYYGR